MAYAFTDNGARQRVLGDVSRVVVKVGTRLLTDVSGSSKAERVRALIDAVSRLREHGLEVLLVSSGAIGAGMTVMGETRRPRNVPQLQAHAAIGQCRLMYLYETACVEHGYHCAQLLLTADDVQHRERHLNVTSCLDALLAKKVLPVINENDSVSVDEIRVGDNDMLAALVATMMRADLTILLTTVDGMYCLESDGSPGNRLSVVSTIDDRLRAMAGGTDGNKFSTGGMATKLRAAEVITRAGESMIVADGTDFAILEAIREGHDVGTLFTESGNGRRMRGHKRFLAFFSEPTGDIAIDEGAVHALRDDGRSLLPSGITAFAGDFSRGDTVRIVDRDHREIARGVTNYSHTDVARIMGVRSSEIGRILNQDACYAEVVHRNYLVLTG